MKIKIYIIYLLLLIGIYISCTPDGIMFNTIHYETISAIDDGKVIRGEGFAETTDPKQRNLSLNLMLQGRRANEEYFITLGYFSAGQQKTYTRFQTTEPFLNKKQLIIPYIALEIDTGGDAIIGSYSIDTNYTNLFTIEKIGWTRVKGHGQFRFIKTSGRTEDTITLTDIRFEVKKYQN